MYSAPLLPPLHPFLIAGYRSLQLSRNTFPQRFFLYAYEARFSGLHLGEALFDYGIIYLIVNLTDIPTSGHEIEFRTDARDALKIARNLQLWRLAGCNVKDIVLKKLESNKRKYPVEKARARNEKYDAF